MLKKMIRKALSHVQFCYVNRVVSPKRKRPVDPGKSERFLCLQMNAIGDAVMTQPAWAVISKIFPQARVDLACSPQVALLFENDPAIHHIYGWEKRRYRPWLFNDFKSIRQTVIQNDYDLIVDFTALPLTAALCARNDMPPSIGFHRSLQTDAGMLDWGGAYDRTYPYSEQAHVRSLMFGLVASVFAIEKQDIRPKIYLDDESRRKAADLLAGHGLKAKTFILVHPGAKWQPRVWPTQNWQKLIRSVRTGMNLPVIILGGSADKKIVEAILCDNGLRDVPHYISIDIKLTAALIQASALCVCHDSAPVHMAAALGVQTVALFGAGLPARTAPPEFEGCRTLYHEMFCSPCIQYYLRDRCRRGINFCMQALSPDEVVRAVTESLPANRSIA